MSADSETQTDECNFITSDVYKAILSDLDSAQTEVIRLDEENKSLKQKILELNAHVQQECERRKDVEANVTKLLNSPSAVTQQMEMWSKKVEILQQITDLQSSLIDKDFILKQAGVIKDLRASIHAESDHHESDITAESQYSVVADETLNDTGTNISDESYLTIRSEATSDKSNLTSTTGSVTDLSVNSSVAATDDHAQPFIESSPKLRPPPLKLKRGESHIIYNSNHTDALFTFPSVNNIHMNDTRRMEVFLNNLKRLDKIPESVKTLLISDSNGHKIRGRDLDSERNTWVISSGGLCLVSTVHALRSLTASYSGINKVVYHMGLNDELHKRQHIGGEREKYLAELSRVTKKVFPQAESKFILPLSGGKMSREAINSLRDDIMKYMPECTIYTPPDMSNMFDYSGVHLNDYGIQKFKTFLINDIIVKRRQRIFSEISGRRSNTTSYLRATDHSHQPVAVSYSRARNVPSLMSAHPTVYHPDQHYPPLPSPHIRSRNFEKSLYRQPAERDMYAEMTAHIMNVLSKHNYL